MSPDLFAGLIAAAVVLGMLAIVAVILLVVRLRRQEHLQRRLEPEAVASRDNFDFNGDRPVLQKLARRGKVIEGWVDGDNESTQLLAQAGWRSSESQLLWYVFQAALPLLMLLLVVVFWFFGPTKLHKIVDLILVIFAGAALSFLLPRWILRGVAQRRRDRIKAEVPLFIHLLVMLFEAGLSLRQVFTSLVNEGRSVLPELGREFELVLRQLEAGAEISEVLKNLETTMNVSDLTGVLGVLRQVDRYGGEIRGPLLEMLGVLEERRSLDLRERVNILSGRMTVVMVLFFFPALLIFVAGPAFLSIIRALGNVNGH